jgi:hypothetical protein
MHYSKGLKYARVSSKYVLRRECKINKWKYKRISSTDYERSKQPQNVKYFNCFGISIINGAGYTREIKSRRVHGKSCFQQEEVAFRQHIGLRFREGTSNVLNLEQL